MKSFSRLFAVSTAVALLSACGGGGGDEAPAPGPTPPPATPVAVTTANQSSVARTTVSGGLGISRSQALSNGGRAQAQTADRELPRAGYGVVRSVAQRVAARAFDARSAAAGTRMRPLAVTSETEPCGLSGSVTTTIDDRDNNDLSAGDVVTITFNQCRDTADDLTNGTVVFTITSVTSATATRVEFSGTMAFQSLAVTLRQDSTQINGTLSIGALITSTALQISMTVAAAGLAIQATAPCYSDTIVYEPGMRIVATETETAPIAATVTINGSFSATSIGGRVTVSTLQPIRQLATDPFPSSGQVLVTGANNSRLRITVISNTQVRLELDADGDGTFESNNVVTWSSILPRAC